MRPTCPSVCWQTEVRVSNTERVRRQRQRPHKTSEFQIKSKNNSETAAELFLNNENEETGTSEKRCYHSCCMPNIFLSNSLKGQITWQNKKQSYQSNSPLDLTWDLQPQFEQQFHSFIFLSVGTFKEQRQSFFKKKIKVFSLNLLSRTRETQTGSDTSACQRFTSRHQNDKNVRPNQLRFSHRSIIIFMRTISESEMRKTSVWHFDQSTVCIQYNC